MSEGKTCPSCGAALMPGDIFCGECGVRVQTPDYDRPLNGSSEDISPSVQEEPSVEEPAVAAKPLAGEYVSPPSASQKAGDWTASRIVAIVVAVGFLLTSLCLCGFGGLALIPSSFAHF
jgi:hypothetical protein